jgi:hypothetical protein
MVTVFPGDTGGLKLISNIRRSFWGVAAISAIAFPRLRRVPSSKKLGLKPRPLAIAEGGFIWASEKQSIR